MPCPSWASKRLALRRRRTLSAVDVRRARPQYAHRARSFALRLRLRRVDAGPHPRLGNTKVGTIRIGELDLAPPEPEDLPPPARSPLLGGFGETLLDPARHG